MSRDSKKRIPKRNRESHPGLDKSSTSRIRREYLDYDYVDKLSEVDKQWLNNFTEEWLGADFRHKGEILHKKKKQKREIYNRNNARNRCALSVSKARNAIVDDTELKNIMENEEIRKSINPNNSEDTLIELIDSGLVGFINLEDKK